MVILKIGGGKSINIRGIIANFAELAAAKTPPFDDGKCLIIHGANALRDETAEKLGIKKTVLISVSGYSSVYSDEQAIDVIMMTYAGLRNKRIVELCQQHDLNAVGLTGLDGRLVQGQRNPGIRVAEGSKRKIIRDFSGKSKSINKNLLNLLLENGYIPVVSIPIADENGCAINSENDDIVAVLQGELQAGTVINFIEAPGLLKDKDNPESMIPELSVFELSNWEERAEGRMRRKLHALRKLCEQGVKTVILCDGRTEQPLKDAMINHKGTVIQ